MYLLSPNGEVHQHSITTDQRKSLIRMVQNAYFDVTRYPGHVATHSQINASEMQRVKAVMVSKAAGSTLRCAQLFCAAATVALVMPAARMFQEPSVCQTIEIVQTATHETLVKDQTASEDLHERLGNVSAKLFREHGCQFHEQTEATHLLIWFLVFSSPAWLAPSMIMVLSVLVWIALRCGTAKPYRLVVSCMLRAYPPIWPHVPTIMYNELEKPEVCDLKSSPLQIWRRLMHPVYLVTYWLVSCILLLAVTFVTSPASRVWCQVMVLLLVRVYFPIMTLFLGTKPNMVDIINWSLANTYVANSCGKEFTDCLFKVSEEYSKTDVWNRLLHCKSSTFNCNMSELHVLLEYFKFCHGPIGKEIKGPRWLIDWHKQLELQDQPPILEVFLDDYGLLLHSGTPADHTETGELLKLKEDVRLLTMEETPNKPCLKGKKGLSPELWKSEVRRIVNDIVVQIDDLHEDAKRHRVAPKSAPDFSSSETDDDGETPRPEADEMSSSDEALLLKLEPGKAS